MHALALKGLATVEMPQIPQGGLFEGLDAGQIDCAQRCLSLRAFAFDRHDELLSCADQHRHYGILQSGVAFDTRGHPSGSQTLIDVLEPGDLFGEGWRAARWPVGENPRERIVVGARRGVIILFDSAQLGKLERSCAAAASIQANLLQSVLGKQERLRTKVEILRHRLLRNRIASYLLIESRKLGTRRFTLLISRGELARYLMADRAAFSRELSRMQADGLISCQRNTYSILNYAGLHAIDQ